MPPPIRGGGIMIRPYTGVPKMKDHASGLEAMEDLSKLTPYSSNSNAVYRELQNLASWEAFSAS